MKRILTVSVHPGSANCVYPVVKILMKKYKIISIVDGIAINIFKKNKLPYKTIDNIKSKKFSRKIIKKIISNIKPDIIFIGNSGKYNLENEFIYAAKKAGIKTIGILDIHRTDYKSEYSIRLKNKDITMFPDKICVLDRKTKKDLIRAGLSKNKIIVTGGPNFDYILKYKRIKKNRILKLREKYKINISRKIILWLSQPTDKDYKFLKKFNEKLSLNNFLDSIKEIKLKDFQVFVRPHPREDKRQIEIIIKGQKSQNIKILRNSTPLIDNLLFSDLVVGMDSTALYEAALLGKKVISYFPTNEIKSVLNGSKKLIVFTKTKKQLKKAILKLLNSGQKTKPTLLKPASPRVVKVIEKELYKSYSLHL